LAYLRSIFPGQFADPAARSSQAAGAGKRQGRFARWVYGHPSIHALERELLADEWAFVGHESQVPRPRDFLTADIGAERALVVRDEDGVLHALRNSCPASPHALVASRYGRFERQIECGAHRLRFGLNGGHLGSSGTDLSDLDFRTVGGLMFARSPARQRPSDVSALPEAWSDADPPAEMMPLEAPLERCIAADWKIVVEQWLQSSPPDLAVTAAAGSLIWRPPILGDSGWSARYYRRLVNCVSRAGWRRQFIAPNQLIETRPDGLSVMQALPLAAARCVLRRSDYTILPPDDAARAALYLVRRLGAYARRSSVALAESVQAGVSEFAYEAAAGRPEAPAVVWFRERLAARIPALALDRPPNGP
jgi:phenylpropionate dioxygenase-like ring-hydroxylating dioxygenase large terminal subunit